ncbi:alanine racemase [Psychrobacillus sp. FSL W7-1457]|uniref:alanine racemase n=1 Tax=unclassified Psychrobacillus TaxID=2636677 RepID=UPI0030FB6A4A
MSQKLYRPTFIEIDLLAIQTNIERLKETLPSSTQIIAVVKANAYGHGDIEVAQAALQSGASMLAVATPEEALHLRGAGIKAEILVLGAAPTSFLPEANAQNITLTAYSCEWIFATKEFKSNVKIHIKIDSGMGRIGFSKKEELKEALAFIKESSSLEITGAYTHFATADDEDTEYFNKQVKKFNSFLGLFEQKPAMIHASNSAAALQHPSQSWDAVRFGISMYGIAPSPFLNNHLPFPLEKPLSLHTEIIHVKKVSEGDSIGYGASYTAKTEEWIGTLPIGYADGLLRKLHTEHVLVKGKRMPFVGKICMDQCMIRLDGPTKVGEKVVLIGKQGDEEIEVEEWAKTLQTIPYEVCCTLSTRIPRIYRK